ncbi:hypothetical protein M3221_22455 [Domibacillus indicus]|nr:biotin/lipoyl-containing protein [Domibacillus indicus]MCM3791104.1 hypothetical protein [Domibacillus indicus]
MDIISLNPVFLYKMSSCETYFDRPPAGGWNPHDVVIKDESIKSAVNAKVKANPKNEGHIAVTMPGTVIKVILEKGDKVKRGDHLMITEAMKMETTVQASFDETVKAVRCPCTKRRSYFYGRSSCGA